MPSACSDIFSKSAAITAEEIYCVLEVEGAHQRFLAINSWPYAGTRWSSVALAILPRAALAQGARCFAHDGSPSCWSRFAERTER